MMSHSDRNQTLISQWVRRPLGNRSLNNNGIIVKKKNKIASKVNINLVSKIVEKENNYFSSSCNVVKVSPRKVVLNTSVQDIDLPVLDKNVATSFSSQLLNQVTDIDAKDAVYPLLVSEYVHDIYQHLWQLETQYKVPELF